MGTVNFTDKWAVYKFFHERAFTLFLFRSFKTKKSNNEVCLQLTFSCLCANQVIEHISQICLTFWVLYQMIMKHDTCHSRRVFVTTCAFKSLHYAYIKIGEWTGSNEMHLPGADCTTVNLCVFYPSWLSHRLFITLYYNTLCIILLHLSMNFNALLTLYVNERPSEIWQITLTWKDTYTWCILSSRLFSRSTTFVL